MAGVDSVAYFVARLMTCALWGAAGFHSIWHFKHTVGDMTRRGIPLASFTLVVVTLMKIVGTVMILADSYVWAVCIAWIAFLVPASYIYHRKWTNAEGKFDLMQYVMFWKNMSLMGGLLCLMLLDASRPVWLLRG